MLGVSTPRFFAHVSASVPEGYLAAPDSAAPEPRLQSRVARPPTAGAGVAHPMVTVVLLLQKKPLPSLQLTTVVPAPKGCPWYLSPLAGFQELEVRPRYLTVLEWVALHISTGRQGF